MTLIFLQYHETVLGSGHMKTFNWQELLTVVNYAGGVIYL